MHLYALIQIISLNNELNTVLAQVSSCARYPGTFDFIYSLRPP